MPEAPGGGYCGQGKMPEGAVPPKTMGSHSPLAKAREWQPIEMAPHDGTPVDLWAGGERITDCHWRTDHWAFPVYLNDREINGLEVLDWVVPTHWMPLPAPPVA
jgi:hypothetical protein